MENFHPGLETEKLLLEFGNIGRKKGELRRLLYDTSWQEAQVWLKDLMEKKGFDVRIDAVGNVFGRIEGREKGTICIGSHFDTVPNAGIYDGALGIIGGILAIEHIKKTHGIPKKSLEVVALAEEEGVRFPFVFWGSKSLAGEASPSLVEKLKDRDGISFREAAEKVGIKWPPKIERRRDIDMFIELHIEQGTVLEDAGIPLGLVTSIAGQMRYICTLSGEVGHAGTIPMLRRRDPLAAFAEIATFIRKLAINYGEPLVATIGKVEVQPNTPNVIPGKVTFTLDIRYKEEKILNAFTKETIDESRKIAETMSIDFEAKKWLYVPPTPMDKTLVETMEKILTKEGFHYKKLMSGAGHDAQIFAKKFSTAMLFVRSKKGISHSPMEYTDKEDLDTGVRALASVARSLRDGQAPGA